MRPPPTSIFLLWYKFNDKHLIRFWKTIVLYFKHLPKNWKFEKNPTQLEQNENFFNGLNWTLTKGWKKVERAQPLSDLYFLVLEDECTRYDPQEIKATFFDPSFSSTLNFCKLNVNKRIKNKNFENKNFSLQLLRFFLLKWGGD